MRLFVAIELPDDVKGALVSLGGGLHGAKWVDPEQMHVTLRFLGEADPGQADDVATALGQIHAPAFSLSVAGLGEFSSRGRVQTLWAGIEAAPPLLSLQAKVEAAARRAGFEPEKRKFHPHVTLARFGQGRPNLGRYFAAHEPLRIGPFAVDEFVLFSSVLGSEGATHYPEARYPLGFAVEDELNAAE